MGDDAKEIFLHIIWAVIKYLTTELDFLIKRGFFLNNNKTHKFFFFLKRMKHIYNHFFIRSTLKILAWKCNSSQYPDWPKGGPVAKYQSSILVLKKPLILISWPSLGREESLAAKYRSCSSWHSIDYIWRWLVIVVKVKKRCCWLI